MATTRGPTSQLLPPFDQPIPKMLIDFAEGYIGFRFDPNGDREVIPYSDFLAARESIADLPETPELAIPASRIVIAMGYESNVANSASWRTANGSTAAGSAREYTTNPAGLMLSRKSAFKGRFAMSQSRQASSATMVAL